MKSNNESVHVVPIHLKKFTDNRPVHSAISLLSSTEQEWGWLVQEQHMLTLEQIQLLLVLSKNSFN